MSAPVRPEEITRDRLIGGRVLLWQPRRGNRASIDAVLLAAAVPARPGERAVDFGAGTGAAALALAARVPDLELTLVDRDAGVLALARRNLAENGREAQARLVALDLTAAAAQREAAGLQRESADHVLMNPPFFEEGRVRTPPDAGRGQAFVAPAGNLETWMRASAHVLAPGGSLTLIHRAEALPACLAALGRRFGGVAVLPVHARPTSPALRVILHARRGTRAPLRLLPPLVLHAEQGDAYTSQAEAVLRDAQPLLLTPA